MPELPTIDPSAIESLRSLSPEGGGEFLRELVEIYLQDTPQRLTELDAALAGGDAKSAMRAAHSIKGSSSNFGAAKLAKISQEIELHCKAGSIVAAGPLVPGLKAEFVLVEQALNQIVRGT